jgi:hypothetical protein
MHLSRLVPALAAIVVLLAMPGAALADCAMPPDIKTAATSADIVFVGSVTATANRNSWATVAVEEVWRGPDQPAEVVIMGGPAGNAATSVDRTFEVGVKYLFFPYVSDLGNEGGAGRLAGAESGLADNSCTSTTPWSAGLLELRPSDARAPIGAAAESGFDFGGLLGPVVAAVVVAVVLLGVGLLARGRQSG